MAVRVNANAASCATPAQCTMREARGTALSPERPSDAATHRFPPFGLVNTAWDSQPRVPRRGFCALASSSRLAARGARRRRLLRRRRPAQDRRASCRDAMRARACGEGCADRVEAPSGSQAARRAATAGGRRRTRRRRTTSTAAMLSRRFSTLSGRPFASSTSSSAACARQPSSVSTGSAPSSLTVTVVPVAMWSQRRATTTYESRQSGTDSNGPSRVGSVTNARSSLRRERPSSSSSTLRSSHRSICENALAEPAAHGGHERRRRCPRTSRRGRAGAASRASRPSPAAPLRAGRASRSRA